MRTYFLRLAAIVALTQTFGCMMGTTNPTVQQQMTIEPRTVYFQKGQAEQTVNVGHTCTCPFMWNTSMRDSCQWLTFPASGTGNMQMHMTIDRSKMPKDTSETILRFTSNGYGADSLVVIAYR